MFLSLFSGNNVRRNIRVKKNNRDLASSLPAQVLVVLASLLLLSIPGESSSSRRQPKPPHKCFVCLPQDKTSMLSKEILDSFPGRIVPDCAAFPNTTAEQASALEFQLQCPKGYSGCLLRISGTEVSRTCSPVKLDDCKIANTIELCYCSDALCNSDKVTMKTWAVRAAEETTRTSRHFHEGETDDEDLLTTGDNHHHQFSDDELADTGSGHFAPEEHTDNLSPVSISSFSPSHSEESSVEDEDRPDEGLINGEHEYPEESLDNAQRAINQTTESEHIPEAVAAANFRFPSAMSLLGLCLCFLVSWRDV